MKHEKRVGHWQCHEAPGYVFGVEEAKSNKDREETGWDCLRIQKKKMVPKRELGRKRKPTKKLRNRGIKWTSENCDFFFDAKRSLSFKGSESSR